jgi:hypothetical protein
MPQQDGESTAIKIASHNTKTAIDLLAFGRGQIHDFDSSALRQQAKNERFAIIASS